MKKIKKLSAKEQVLHALRKSIFYGKLEKGQEISQEEIAELLGVSRMPVREAFQILNKEGLIYIQNNRRVVVVGLKEADAEVHYDIRALLEGLAAEKASNNPEFFDQLIEINNKIKNEKEDSFVHLNEELHRLIWKAADSPRLYSMLSDLWNGLQPQFPEFVNFQIQKSSKEHDQLINAIVNKEGKLARNLAEQHVLRTKKDFLRSIFSK